MFAIESNTKKKKISFHFFQETQLLILWWERETSLMMSRGRCYKTFFNCCITLCTEVDAWGSLPLETNGGLRFLRVMVLVEWSTSLLSTTKIRVRSSLSTKFFINCTLKHQTKCKDNQNWRSSVVTKGGLNVSKGAILNDSRVINAITLLSTRRTIIMYNLTHLFVHVSSFT